MNKNLMIGGILVLVLVVGLGWYMISQSSQNTSPTTSSEVQSVPTEPASSTSESSPSGTTGTEMVKEITVTSSGFKFNPPSLTINKGDKIKITFVNPAGTHNFMIDEFNVATKTINAGAQDSVEFTADKSGTFEYYCGVANHRAMGMKGTLTVI